MPLYEIKAYMESKTYDKCWLQIEASSPEEALALAKKDPDSCEYIDGKCVDVYENIYVDKDEWKVIEIK